MTTYKTGPAKGLEKSSFVTLTYDDEHLPEKGELQPKDWTLFAKKVRNHLGPFKFFHCGEYGEELRPHIHACMFGHSFLGDKQLWKTKNGNPLYLSETLQRLWGKGFTTVGALTFDSAAYVARYIMKKNTGEKGKSNHTTVDPNTGECHEVMSPYATMSRNPGLGKKWYDKYKEEVWAEDCVVINGKKMRPPKYYDYLLKKENKQRWQQIEQKRKQAVYETAWNQTEERLNVRHEVLEAKLRRSTREVK